MDNNIHINPESIGKFKALSAVPSPEGYESPITGYISQLSQQIIEQRDNEVVAQISEQIAVDVNKEELIKALNYDRNQFNEGYRKGYRDAQEKYKEADRWIPVSERLPDKNGKCLVSLDFGDVSFDYYDKDWGFVCYVGNVIAWKSMPKHYTESEDK